MVIMAVGARPAIGFLAGSGFWQYLIKNRIRIDNLGKPAWKVSYADFYGVEQNGEYKWVV
jgi:hypothetical protein